MSSTCILLIAMFGQVASAEDVVTQMQIRDGQIETLEFLFQLETVRGPGYYEVESKIEKEEVRGRLRYRAPHEVKLERLSESGEILEVRAVSPDGTKAKGFSIVPKTGSVNGYITAADGGFYFSPFMGISGLFQHAALADFPIYFKAAKAKKEREFHVAFVGKVIRLTSGDVSWDVDPEHGYLIVADIVVTSKGSTAEIVSAEQCSRAGRWCVTTCWWKLSRGSDDKDVEDGTK